MSALQSLRAWTTPEWPSTATYGALARFGVRRSALVVVLGVGSQLVIQLPAGQYASAAVLVGAVVAAAIGYLAGVAVAFDDAGVAVVATVGTVAVLAATAGVARTLGLDDGQLLGIVLALVVVPGALASGVGGYTFAERASG